MNAPDNILRRLLRPVRNEEGATLVFFGLMVVMLFATFAMAVDVGARLNARSEAQRAADAGALAGAALFWGVSNPAAVENAARAEAIILVSANYAGGAQAVADTVFVWPSERRVGVQVSAEPNSLFGRLIGIMTMPVRAYSEAQVKTATATKCVKPFAVPDLWSGAATNQATAYPMTGTPPYYEQFVQTTNNANTATGYGGYVAPYGSPLTLAITSPGEAPVPSIALHIELPTDPTLTGPCPFTGGNAEYRLNICKCNNNNFEVGSPIPAMTSSTARLGNAYHGFHSLVQGDPSGYWDTSTNQPVSPSYPDIVDSPRVIKLALFDPIQLRDLTSGNGNTITPNNVALFWLEWEGGPPGQYSSIKGRFMGFPGDGNLEGNAPGPNIQALQLIK